MKKIIDAIKSGLATLSPNCREASRLQSEALDKKLSFSKRVGLRLHLAICKWCRRYGKQIRFLRSAAGQCPDHLTGAVPQKLSAEARERIRQRLQSEK
ncbi:MAG TPA: zf-HC2 domain-containing protein [Verrucomicrobiae bacterium]|nr:zf-HC2 domain-containing protein [Verrucomicrobiae bacterium]